MFIKEMNNIKIFTQVFADQKKKYTSNYIPLRTEHIWNNQRTKNMPGSLKQMYKLYIMQYWQTPKRYFTSKKA